jgi:hypothetical protein
MKTLHGRIHAADDCTAYFGSVLSYEMYTNSTETITFINIFISQGMLKTLHVIFMQWMTLQLILVASLVINDKIE